MCAVDTMKRQYNEMHHTLGPSNNEVAIDDDVDAMIIKMYAYEQKQRRTKRRRVVRFSEHDNKEHSVAVDDNTWLSREEHMQNRSGALDDIRTIWNSGIQPKALLDETVYNGCDGDDGDLTKQAAWATPPDTILDNLTQWAQYIDPGRGLENQVNGKLGEARRKHRLRSIRAVMVGQAIAREEQKLDSWELLGVVSQKYSALAKQHALLIGKADEKAAQDVCI